MTAKERLVNIWDDWLKGILKDVIANLIAAIILILLGSTNLFKRQIRSLIRMANEEAIVIRGKVENLNRDAVNGASVYCMGIDSEETRSDEYGNFELKITFKDERGSVEIIAEKGDYIGRDTVKITDNVRLGDSVEPITLRLKP